MSLQIRAVYQRALQLQQYATKPPVDPSLLEQALKELYFVLEELQTADEELRHQNQALLTAQQTLMREQQRYQTLFELAPSGYLTTNLQGKILQANRAAADLLAVKQTYLINKPLLVFIHADDQSQFQAQLTCLQQKSTWEVRLMPRNGQPVSVSLIVTRTQGASEKTDLLLWAIHDIEVLKQTELDLQQAKTAAEAANLAKSVFLSNVSHELRTPLHAILGFSQLMLRDSELNNAHQQHADIIYRSGTQLLNLVNSVLEVCKIKANRAPISIHNFDLYALLADIQKIFQLVAQEKGLSLTFNFDAELPQYIQTDTDKLRQVLLNLLSNAIKFTDTGTVTLTITRRDLPQRPVAFDRCLLQFQVQDTGLGIEPDEFPLLFQPFSQTRTGRAAQTGTGLGLSISQQFVQLLGGEITVSSQINQGTCFQFEIPVYLGSPVEIANQTEQTVVGLADHQPDYRILIVEESWIYRTFLVSLLCSLGFQVKEATSAQEAVQQWQCWRPQLVLINMQMPDLSSHTATQHIRLQPGSASTIILGMTDLGLEEQRSLMLAAGCDDWLCKPIDPALLLDKIAQYLGVQYCYGEADVAVSSLSPLTQAHLAEMPQAWIKQLHQAARSIDEERIQQLIAQIPPEQAILSQMLQSRVKQFDMETIMTVAQAATLDDAKAQ